MDITGDHLMAALLIALVVVVFTFVLVVLVDVIDHLRRRHDR